jgi:hypothetical protein
MVARRARKMLTGLPPRGLGEADVGVLRAGLYDLGLALLRGATRFTEDDVTRG